MNEIDRMLYTLRQENPHWRKYDHESSRGYAKRMLEECRKQPAPPSLPYDKEVRGQ